jgi:hypothetical protein
LKASMSKHGAESSSAGANRWRAARRSLSNDSGRLTIPAAPEERWRHIRLVGGCHGTDSSEHHHPGDCLATSKVPVDPAFWFGQCSLPAS